MSYRTGRAWIVAAFLAVALTVALAGCGKKGALFGGLVPNRPPSVTLSATRLGDPDTSYYAYALTWRGTDPDGSVTGYQYAIDPPTVAGQDTLWVTTTSTGGEFWFRATDLGYDPVNGWRAYGYHVFVLRAIDDDGAASPVYWQAFYPYTLAPRVWITRPTPSVLIEAQVPAGARITWQGEDPDGLRSKRPVQYKYRLFASGDPEFEPDRAKQYPDSLRLFYAARNFAGWDSVGGDTTSLQLANLQAGRSYLFVVVAIDEAGTYSAPFSLDGNMLQFEVGFAATMGPLFTVWSEFLWFAYQSGTTSIDPLGWIEVEVPAGTPLTFRWSAVSTASVPLTGYRWRLDGDPADETPRTDEATDVTHWSRRELATTSATVGPFAGSEEHLLYVDVVDEWDLRSVAVVHLRTVQPTFEHDLLVVDDTRLPPDRLGANGVPLRYTGEWPAAAELDTFLFARGGFPWRGPQGVAGTLPSSPAGVFAGYAYDTLGTRQGLQVPTDGVPLSVLGRYRHVLWLTDVRGATSQFDPTASVDPVSTLKWMSARGRANTLAAYAGAGGEVWLLGGSAAYCNLIDFDAVGGANNNSLYGPGRTVFSAVAGELVPGRMIHDAAHWRSECVTQLASATPVRSAAAAGGWTQPGWRYAGVHTAPDYSRLPAQLRRRSLALGDSLPPTRAGQSGTYYTFSSLSVEYLSQANAIVEDVDADPVAVTLQSTLDTLLQFSGGSLATIVTGGTPVAMTYYHGVESPRFVFSGFDLWTWSRQDVVALVDFVLGDVWGLARSAPAARVRAAMPPARGAAPAAAAGLPVRGAARR